MNKLQPAQRTAVKLLVCGLTRKQIAVELGLGHSTVKNYIWRARKKLGCETVEQMMFQLGREEIAETVLQRRR